MVDEVVLKTVVIAAAPVVASLLFIGLWSSGQRLHPLEEGATPLLWERCGGRFGVLNLTPPFVRVAVYPDAVVIAYLRRLAIPYADLDRVVVERRLLSRGVRLHHARRDLPRPLVLWSREPERLADLLERGRRGELKG